MKRAQHQGDAVATARTSPDARAVATATTARPAACAGLEAWRAYYEATAPCGEFNELLARMDAGLE